MFVWGPGGADSTLVLAYSLTYLGVYHSNEECILHDNSAVLESSAKQRSICNKSSSS